MSVKNIMLKCSLKSELLASGQKCYYYTEWPSTLDNFILIFKVIHVHVYTKYI